MNKQNYIFVRYSANPNWPDEISHKDPHLHHLTKAQIKKFELSQYNEAWNFIMKCTSPITKLNVFFDFKWILLPKYIVATLIAVILPITLKKFSGEIKLK